MKQKINDTAFWLKNKIFRPKAFSKYKELENNQNLSEEALKKLNWEKRKNIVNHAYNNTKFYKQFYDSHGFHPSMLKTEGDWEKVPILERSMVRENFNNMIMNEVSPKRLILSTTGGSSGQPQRVYHDKNFPTEALAWRYLKWWSVSPADNCGITHRKVPVSHTAVLKDAILWFPTKRAFLNASSFSDKDIEGFIYDLSRKKIKRIVGYVGAIERVAEYVIKNNIELSEIKHVWTTSAPLTSSARNKIEKAFGCKVMDQYGSCEIMSIAQQCPYCNGLHLNSDVNHVDIVDSQNNIIIDFRYGDVLVTNMESLAFPLIKYRIGDKCNYLHPKNKKCGLPFPLLNFVSGRISDCMTTPSGIILSGDYLTTIFDDYADHILSFQVCQKKDNSILIKVVTNPNEPNTDAILSVVKSTIEEKVRHEVPVHIEKVNVIPDDRGKQRYIIKE